MDAIFQLDKKHKKHKKHMKYNFEINDRQIVVNNKYYAIGQLNKHLSYHFTICIIAYFITNVNNFIRNIIYLFILIYINLNTIININSSTKLYHIHTIVY